MVNNTDVTSATAPCVVERHSPHALQFKGARWARTLMRWLGWSVARLDARDTPIAGVSWDGASWQALGDAAASADASGSLALPLVEQAGRQDLRLSFWGITSEPAGLVSPPITFAVPAPGAGALVAVAMVVARRRRG